MMRVAVVGEERKARRNPQGGSSTKLQPFLLFSLNDQRPFTFISVFDERIGCTSRDLKLSLVSASERLLSPSNLPKSACC